MTSPKPDYVDRADLVLGASFETLLVLGGDDRMHLRPATGLNKYGAAPHQRAAVPFGSCTSSSPTRVGVQGARAALYRMRRAARVAGEMGVDNAAEHILHELRSELLHHLELTELDVDVAFSPSGTDVEYLALALTRGGVDRPVVSVVVGPSEVGGGTTHAAGGKHFQKSVPSGEERTVGAPIDDELGAAVKVRTVVLRDEDGVAHPQKDLDDEVVSLVDDAVASGAKVLLHVVAHSKTGVHAPSLACVDRLKTKYDDDVVVMIDAAQGRVSRRGLREVLRKGHMVLFTGSKFYGGPPFSGALIVPQGLKTKALTTYSSGLRDYLTAADVPRSWTSLRSALPKAPNLGLVLRWKAAVAEIAHYYACDGKHRLDILQAWERDVPEVIGNSRIVRLVPVKPIMADADVRLLESKTTVFPFFLHRTTDDAPLGMLAMKRIFHWLNRDISGLLPDLPGLQKAVLARRFHIGQPVLLSGDADDERVVLRIALGGPLVTRVAEDPHLAPTYEGRLRWLSAQVDIFRAKVELIVEHLDELLALEPKEPGA